MIEPPKKRSSRLGLQFGRYDILSMVKGQTSSQWAVKEIEYGEGAKIIPVGGSGYVEIDWS